MKAYIRATKTVSSKDLESELEKIKEIVKDIPGVIIVIEDKEK